MFRKSTITFFLVINMFLAGCSVSLQAEFPTATAPLIITATLPPSPTPRPSETPLPSSPPPMAPRATPVQGTTSTQLNVRAEPSTASNVLGIIAANQPVQIVGQDPGGNWWQIVYEAGIDGKGWVTAQYVKTASKPEVPVIGGGGVDPNSGNNAVIVQQLNIRTGPGTSFNSLGILNANDVVNLTGKNRDGTWLQIEFSGGAGWINAAFVKADHVDALPIVSDLGEVVGTGTPMDTPLPPTPTIVPAPMDFDSAETPLKTILFDRAGTQTLIYNGDVSVPNGDTEDWIAFTPYDNIAFVSIQCAGNGSLRVEITGSESILACDEADIAIPVQAGTIHLIHIEAVPTPDSLQYVNYILTIKARL